MSTVSSTSPLPVDAPPSSDPVAPLPEGASGPANVVVSAPPLTDAAAGTEPTATPPTGSTPPPVSALAETPLGTEPRPLTSLETLVRERLSGTLPAELQAELAALLVLREEAATVLGPPAVRQIELGLYALLAKEPNLPFAQSIHKSVSGRIEDKTRPLRLSALMRTNSPSLQVILGLGMLLPFASVVGGLAHWKLADVNWTIFNLPPRLLLLTLLGGMVGSVASILVRLRDFEQSQGATPASLVLLGFSKPLVGGFFALFALAVMQAQLLPIKLPPDAVSESYFFLALSFLSGFSERFAQDVVARLEDQLIDDDKKEQEPVPVPAVAPAQREP